MTKHWATAVPLDRRSAQEDRGTSPSIQAGLPPSGPPQRIAGYELVEKLGASPHAVRYRGFALSSQGKRPVLVEHVTPTLAHDADFLSALRGEAEAALRVQHPNLLKLIDLKEEQGQVLLVTELSQGVLLSALLAQQTEQQSPFPSPIAVALASGILRGLDALHNARLGTDHRLSLHGQVHPENVQVNLQGIVKLLPACLLQAAHGVQAETSRSPARTPYHAPEYWDSRQSVDERADIYAVSVLLWQMLTAVRLSSNAQGLVGPSKSKALPPIRMLAPDVSPELESVVLRGMSADPASRFTSAGEMAHALEQVVRIANYAAITAWVAPRNRAAAESPGERARESLRVQAPVTPAHVKRITQPASAKRPSSETRQVAAPTAAVRTTTTTAPSATVRGAKRRRWVVVSGALAAIACAASLAAAQLLPASSPARTGVSTNKPPTAKVPAANRAAAEPEALAVRAPTQEPSAALAPSASKPPLRNALRGRPTGALPSRPKVSGVKAKPAAAKPAKPPARAKAGSDGF